MWCDEAWLLQCIYAVSHPCTHTVPVGTITYIYRIGGCLQYRNVFIYRLLKYCYMLYIFITVLYLLRMATSIRIFEYSVIIPNIRMPYWYSNILKKIFFYQNMIKQKDNKLLSIFNFYIPIFVCEIIQKTRLYHFNTLRLGIYPMTACLVSVV